MQMKSRIVELLCAAALAAAGCAKNDAVTGKEAASPEPAADASEATDGGASAEAAPAAKETPAPAPAAAEKKPLKPIEKKQPKPAAEPGSADELIAIAEDLRDRGEFSEASRTLSASLDKFSGGDYERIAGMIGDLRDMRHQANELEYAVRMLSSGSYAELRVATSELSKAGDVGRILLRRIVRSGTNELAVAQAVKLLSHSASATTASVSVTK